GDLLERLTAAGYAESDGPGEIGVEHQEPDHADRLDAVPLRAEVRPIRRTAPEQAGPPDQLHPDIGTGQLLREALTLGKENPAQDLHAFQVSAQPEEMVDLVAGQRVLDQPVKERARLCDRGIESGWAGVEPPLGALAAQVKIETVDLAPGIDSE